MKKLTLNTFVCLALLYLNSCKKEISNNTNANEPVRYTVALPDIPNHANIFMGPNNETILQFNSISDWENTLHLMQEFNDSLLSVYESKYPGFISQRMRFEGEDSIENPNEDDILATNLSNNGVVIIENKAYMPDFINDLIYVCKVVNIVNISNLINKHVSDTSIFAVYDSEIEVLHLNEEELELSLKSNNRNVDRRRCREKRADKDKDKSGDRNYCNTDKRLKAKIVYQKAGIWFSLLIDIDHYRKNSLGIYRKEAKDISVAYTFRAKKRCGTEWNGQNTSYPAFNFQNIDTWRVRLHDGSNSLSKYDLWMSTSVADDCGTPNSTISWAGRIIHGY